jgi:hypothetical protein
MLGKLDALNRFKISGKHQRKEYWYQHQAIEGPSINAKSTLISASGNRGPGINTKRASVSIPGNGGPGTEDISINIRQ